MTSRDWRRRRWLLAVAAALALLPAPVQPCASSISKRPSRPARPPPPPPPEEEPRTLPRAPAEPATTAAPSGGAGSASASASGEAGRSNVTFPTYKCPHPYSEYYCLNEAKCFTIIIQDSPLYNCECRDGFVGQRCEYKDLDGSYLLSRSRLLLETASIASGAGVALLLLALIGAAVWARRKALPPSKEREIEAPPPPRLQPFFAAAAPT